MATSRMKVEQASANLGAIVTGVDLSEAAYDSDFVWQVKKLLAEHLVVLFPRQQLTGDTAQYFHSQFGVLIDLKRKGNNAHHVPGKNTEFIKVISNGIGPDGRPLGDGDSQAQVWHSDSTSWEVPSSFVSFYCRQTPATPPKTSFLNMIRVYDSLTDSMRERIKYLRVIHHQYPNQIEARTAREGASLPLEERKVGRIHPIVRRHLPSGRAGLFLPTRRDSIVVGWGEKESRDLLEELWAIVNDAPYQWSHAMTPDDFIMWDNSATVHSREGWPQEKTRVMWHLTAGSEVPTPFFPLPSINMAGMTDQQRREAMKDFQQIVA